MKVIYRCFSLWKREAKRTFSVSATGAMYFSCAQQGTDVPFLQKQEHGCTFSVSATDTGVLFLPIMFFSCAQQEKNEKKCASVPLECLTSEDKAESARCLLTD